ncbi:alpha/beta hydrolase [Dyadobacter sandarakinus]|uniref:Prolyl oligopeptidase family serine peptidase n=1 Tax=Dyadobacter sandarakinus TaxID=2747268 RepID=A0ABX7I6L0_9BACT|nr:alpha/beta hydrolase-fold protein [Dyadobacter sandarakinus]QRR01177.1 prolyl oligopeptidase family serine peptidase [Dyadobacter sandarakinus]
MKKAVLCLSFLISCSLLAQAAIVDTVETYSNAMKKSIKAVVVRPDNYNTASAMPVVYLLHGYSGNYADWITKANDFKSAADRYQMMIVCPDGGFGSWYWDSPADNQWKYETYLSGELVRWIDSKYKTIKDRKGRAITGLSMGGHGALYLAMRHQDIFGAAGSMSGGVDIRPYPNNWDMAKRLGTYAEQPERWERNTVINMLHLLTPNALALMIDCGTEDFFFKVNEKLHEELLYRGIQHDYVTRPGAHNWPYWNNAVKYQLLFMSEFFSRK